MSLTFSSTTTAAGLAQLNSYFAASTYVFGHALSAADAALYKEFNGKTPDASKYPHVARWVSHVATYSEEERAGAAAVAGLSVSVGAVAAAGGGGSKGDESDDDSGLDFLDDSDDDEEDPVEAAKRKAAEKKAAAAEAKKKSKKRPAIAKSRIVFEVKPYDMETDLEALAGKIKGLKLEGDFWDEKLSNCEDERCSLAEGCKWGEGHRKEPVAFGLFKLIIQCIVQDELVGSDDLIDLMTEKFEDDIQSIDIAAFDKAS